jgi:16S rRNA (uracil1498-N3)-methyltransferase
MTTAKPRIRLFVPHRLAEGRAVALSREQTHYVANVMRASVGERVALFNGADGQWLARIESLAKAGAAIVPEAQTRPQELPPDLWLLAAPLKRDCTDLVAEKSVELGVARLWPVFTSRTNTARVNMDRLAARLVEAAEQCERLDVPELAEPMALDKLVAGWPADRTLYFLDETGQGQPLAQAAKPGAAAILVGPEGGFDEAERKMLRACPQVVPVTLGPRILRAETAAMAALAVWQSVAGDWGGRSG